MTNRRIMCTTGRFRIRQGDRILNITKAVEVDGVLYLDVDGDNNEIIRHRKALVDIKNNLQLIRENIDTVLKEGLSS